MREAGLTVASDRFGNLFGSTDGNKPGARVSMAGSHIDTVPDGGSFDGTLGVVGAIEAVNAIRESDARTNLPLEVVVWRCEEPVRFAQGKVGSSLFAGTRSVEDLRPLDPRFSFDTAIPVEEEATQREPTRVPASYLELHIEQGRRLEEGGLQIGVVTAVAAPTRLSIVISGRTDHSGATPMGMRRDALCAAAELVLAVESAASAESRHESVGTTTSVECVPGAINVVPGEARMIVDLRGVNRESVGRVVAAIEDAVGEVERARDVRVDIEFMEREDPTPLDPHLVEIMSKTVSRVGLTAQLMSSGAGHDAQNVAALCPAGMLFVPSVDGVSHSREEFTRDADVVAGVQALSACWWRIAGRADWE
jgi:hydantoinase/carbamoylase family amidase